LGKLTVEKYLEIFKRNDGLDYTALRYSNVYGPRQNAKGEAGVVSIFIDNALSGNDLNIFGDGNATRDFVYVKDVVEANIKAMGLSGMYNVSTNVETSVKAIAENILRLTESTSKIVYGDAISGELARSRLSYERLKSKEWSPKYDIDSGLKETVEYFRT